MRYNDEHKEAELNTFFGNVNDPTAANGIMIGLFAASQADFYELDEENWSGMISLQADVTDSVMLYATIANGFKSGGFNGAPGSGVGSDVAYDPEESLLFELGAKAKLWDDRAQLNVAIYNNELTDWQAISFDGDSGSFLVNNAGVKVVQGFDLDAMVKASPRPAAARRFFNRHASPANTRTEYWLNLASTLVNASMSG